MPQRNLSAVLRQWHQRAGLLAFSFLIWLGVSGFLINQSARWGYDTVRLDWPWLTALYGLGTEPPDRGFEAQDYWLAYAGDRVLLNGEPLEHIFGAPRGLVVQDDGQQRLLFAATSDAVIVLGPEGALIDDLRSPVLPLHTVHRVGIADNAVVVEGDDTVQSLDGGLSWTPATVDDIDWSRETALSEDQRTALVPYSRPSISIERILVDAHSGQLLGRYGVWLVNAVACVTVILGISGVWMTWRTGRNRRRRQRAAAV